MNMAHSNKPFETTHASERRECITVAVVGIDGAGKSSISALLADRLSSGRLILAVGDGAILYRDGHEQAQRPLSDLPRRALAKYTKSSKSLKHYKFPKLAELMLRDRLITSLRKRQDPDAIVLDGSPLVNLGAWTKLYKQDLDEQAIGIGLKVMNGRDVAVSEERAIRGRLPELFTLRKLGLAHMQLPQAVVFLDVSPATCLERIHQRGGSMQVHETEGRLAELREGYVACCAALESMLGVRVATVRGKLDREATVETAFTFAKELL